MIYEPMNTYDNRYSLYTSRLTKGRRIEVLKNLQKAYGGEHVFRFVFLKLLNERPKAAQAFGLHFGYHNGNPITLDEVAGIMGITREYVRQLVYKCFRILCSLRDEVWIEYGYMSTDELFMAKKFAYERVREAAKKETARPDEGMSEEEALKEIELIDAGNKLPEVSDYTYQETE